MKRGGEKDMGWLQWSLRVLKKAFPLSFLLFVQLLFFVVVVFCFVASILFNIFLPSSKVSVTVRHFVLTAVGVLVVIYTYGVM